MIIYIYVEGDTELAALPKILAGLFASRRIRMPIPLYGTKFLKRIGKAAAQIRSSQRDAHVFACPDLAPNEPYRNTPWAYQDYSGLQATLRREVRRRLRACLSPRKADAAIRRFHAHPFRHDFEVLLLALPDRLRQYLRTSADITKHYNARRPEDQDFERYPKRVVSALFRKHLRRAYDPVKDGRRFFEYATAEHVRSIESICPCFAELMVALRSLVAAG